VGLSYYSPSLYPGLCYHLYPNASDCGDYVVESFQCPENALIVAKCPSGHYLGANFQCLECGAGTYQTGKGMIVESNCTECAAGKFSVSTGSTSEESCTALNGPLSNLSATSGVNDLKQTVQALPQVKQRRCAAFHTYISAQP
jgi:predicted RNA-binding Zn-ribbon protein involved in translation (DUF1610 family)